MHEDGGRGAVGWLGLAWLATALGVVAGLTLGLGPIGVGLVAFLAPNAAAVVVVVVVTVKARRPIDSAARRGTRGARHRAAMRVAALEARLAAVQRADPAADITRAVPVVLELHRARLTYARQVLREEGDLPTTLADALLAQHRALRDLVDRSLPNHRRAAGQ